MTTNEMYSKVNIMWFRMVREHTGIKYFLYGYSCTYHICIEMSGLHRVYTCFISGVIFLGYVPRKIYFFKAEFCKFQIESRTLC